MSTLAELDARIDDGVARTEPIARVCKWPEPEPLADPADMPEPYPIEHLPPIIGDAVTAYQHFGRQPVALVAGAALAAVSLAVQGLVDVRRDGLLCGPVSLSFLHVAESGERKTAGDRIMRAGADRWHKETLKRLAPKIAERAAMLEAFEAERAGMAAALRSEAAKKKSDARDANVDQLKRELLEHAKKQPIAAPVPVLFQENATIEGLAKSLRAEWPSSSWWSNEGGSVIGGRGFSDEAAMRTLATLNALWDGQPLDRSRATETRTIVHGRRLTVSLMVQPIVFGRLVTGQDGLARGLGALARFLACWPETTAGTRYYRTAPDHIPEVSRFHNRIRDLLAHALPMSFDLEAFRANDGEEVGDPLELNPAQLRLLPAAFEVWRQLHDDVEYELRPEGDYSSVRDVAAKTADNGARLAAIFHALEHGPGGMIGADDMARAGAIAVWHLHEARRMLAGAAVAGDGDERGDAKILANWLAKQPKPPTLQAISQLAPYRLRKNAPRDRAIEFLQAKWWLRPEQRDGQTVIVLNPAVRGAP